MDETLRRDFDMPQEDEEHLNSINLPWETVIEEKVQWLIISSYTVPEGYNLNAVSLAIQVPQNYPTAGFDMVYFCPALSRKDGVKIGATESTIKIRNTEYQRWSRHFTAENPWRSGIDNVSTYLSIIEEWLMREFKKN
jgi:hypothetical protein